MFQHTAARRRLQNQRLKAELELLFQHTAARRRLQSLDAQGWSGRLFQHTAARRRLRIQGMHRRSIHPVSTHSRPKAAAPNCICSAMSHCGFNTQPPEGGCSPKRQHAYTQLKFQHTAARRRLQPLLKALLHQVSQP